MSEQSNGPAAPTRERILVIEDEALVARELKSRLTQMGWDVVGIAYGDEAPALARETRPDLILTDIHLKNGVDGIDVAHEICSEMDIPVVFLTAYSDDETVRRAKAVTPFGYIIKPVENRELQITIDIALYKFRVDKELRETQQLLQTALACIGSAVVFLGKDGAVTQMNEDASRLFNGDRAGVAWPELLGLRAGSTPHSVIANAMEDGRIARMPAFLLGGERSQMTLVDGIAGPMEHGTVLILREVTQIDDDLEDLAVRSPLLTWNIDAPELEAMSQMLIAPEDVPVPEIASLLDSAVQRMNTVLRATDFASVFADSLISVNLPGTSLQEAGRIADLVLKELSALATFSIGVASTSAEEAQPIELFRRSLAALNQARVRGGDMAVLWDAQFERSVFTEEGLAPEYRQMLLLWNVMNDLAKPGDVAALAEEFARHLFRFLDLEKLAILTGRVDAQPSLVSGYQSEVGKVQSLELLALPDEQKMTGDGWWQADLGQGYRLILFSNVVMQAADQRFLQTLVGYFQSVVSRLEMSADHNEVVEEDNDELVFRSPQIEGIVESIKLVAPTDATVLIHGESGTGKEVLARFLHQQSPRSTAPFIIVDCGAVVASLIESELFGHVRGAFTGADHDFTGRLREANGGTVLLDEIGELPMDVQVKLLRFVQDRQFAAVGSSDYQSVDTRIVAATNRDLHAMVESGQFREDLYYRLNVFTLNMPPLKDRPDDILMLAGHYLRHFGQRYGRKGMSLSTDAEQVMLTYAWPGNVRELVNVINRAVILCREESVRPVHLGLFGESPADAELDSATSGNERKAIDLLLDRALAAPVAYPVGQWLEDALMQQAVDLAGGVVNRAAEQLAIPEATLRRRMAKVRADRAGGNTEIRTLNDWVNVGDLFQELKELSTKGNVSLLDIASSQLIQGLESRNVTKIKGAGLMGVSLPTYRKLSS